MSIVRNTVVLRNATLGALVVLALFECNVFVAVHFDIKGVFCKENRTNTLRTSRVHGPHPCTRHVHGRLHGPTRPVRGRVHAPFTAVYTAVYTRIRVHRRYKAVYSPYTRPCTRPVHSCIDGPCTRPVHGSVNGPCTRPRTRPVVYMAGRPTGAVYTFPDGTLRPCAARHGRVLGPFTARSRQCIRPCTAVRHVHTSTPQLKGRVRAKYTSVYTASTQSCTWQVGLHGRVHRPRRHVTAVGRVHGRNVPCTRSCTRLILSRVHVRQHGPCRRPRTRTVCRNGPRTAVACRLGTCTRPSTRAVTLPCTRHVDGRKRQCTQPVYTAENGRAHGPYTAVYTSRYGPYTAV